MNIKASSTVKTLERRLESGDLLRAYDCATKLRSQLLSLIYEQEHGLLANLLTDGITDGKTITLTIHEPLPPLKELTAAMQDHWVELMQTSIAKAEEGGTLPRFAKAFVWIEVVTPKHTDNAKLWDTSNRAVNLIINNLKGVFFEDDNHEHMAFGVVGKWGEKGVTIVHIRSFDELERIMAELKMPSL